MDPTVIDKSQPINRIKIPLSYAYLYYGVRARCAYALSGVRGVQALMLVTPPVLAGIVLYGQNDLVSGRTRVV